MTTTSQSPESFLPLAPAVLHILLALADGEKHGYAIMQEVEANTEGAVKMGSETLYVTIKHMLSSGLFEESDERPDPELDDERRCYYRLSDLGRPALRVGPSIWNARYMWCNFSQVIPLKIPALRIEGMD